MISYREEVIYSWVQFAPSVRGLAALLRMSAPLGLRAIIDRLRMVESVPLESDINTNDNTPINGHVKLELRSDGSYVFSGHMRATGFTSYRYGLQAWAAAGSKGTIVAAQRVGEVFGSDTPGPRPDNWSQPGNNKGIKLEWRSLRDGSTIGFHMNAHISGVLGTAADVLEHALNGIGPDVIGRAMTGLIVLIGEELTDMHLRIGKSDDQNPDILGSIPDPAGLKTLLVGPYGLIPAMYFAAIGVSHRPMRQSERDYADRVFNGTVDFDQVTITNLLSADGRKFTIPSIGNSILVNLGEAFDHPLTYQDNSQGSDYPEPGSVFIHELTHAWQITNNSFLGVICGKSDNYDYKGDSMWNTRPWSSFNNEQQAHIVDDWYGAHVSWSGTYNYDAEGIPVTELDSMEAVQDKAFGFIRDNIRTGTL
jgi:hypothetical protein